MTEIFKKRQNKTNAPKNDSAVEFKHTLSINDIPHNVRLSPIIVL